MKRSVKAAMYIAATFSFQLASASSLPVKTTNENNLNTCAFPQDDWKRERDEFRAEVNKRIEKNQKRINELRAEAKSKKTEVRKEYDEKVNDLEKQNKKLKVRMDDFKDDTKDGWQKFKKEFNHDMDQLGDAIANLFENNKK